MNGVDAAFTIRQMEIDGRLPIHHVIMAITSDSATDEDSLLAQLCKGTSRYPFDSVLEKPFNVNRFIQELDNISR